MPQRIQLSRRKGWRKPEGAIVVARPSKWGNPFVLRQDVPMELRPFLVDPCHPKRADLLEFLRTMTFVRIMTSQQAVDAYAWAIIEQPHLMLSLGELRGHDLACWCKLSDPCHADVLLELANRP